MLNLNLNFPGFQLSSMKLNAASDTAINLIALATPAILAQLLVLGALVAAAWAFGTPVPVIIMVIVLAATIRHDEPREPGQLHRGSLILGVLLLALLGGIA